MFSDLYMTRKSSGILNRKQWRECKVFEVIPLFRWDGSSFGIVTWFLYRLILAKIKQNNFLCVCLLICFKINVLCVIIWFCDSMLFLFLLTVLKINSIRCSETQFKNAQNWQLLSCIFKSHFIFFYEMEKYLGWYRGMTPILYSLECVFHLRFETLVLGQVFLESCTWMS